MNNNGSAGSLKRKFSPDVIVIDDDEAPKRQVLSKRIQEKKTLIVPFDDVIVIDDDNDRKVVKAALKSPLVLMGTSATEILVDNPDRAEELAILCTSISARRSYFKEAAIESPRVQGASESEFLEFLIDNPDRAEELAILCTRVLS